MTTFNGGSLGSCIDEERSQLRYVMWIAEFSESSNLWTQIALSGTPGSMSAWVSFKPILDHGCSFNRLGRRWGSSLHSGALLKIATRRRTWPPSNRGYAARLACLLNSSSVVAWCGTKEQSFELLIHLMQSWKLLNATVELFAAGERLNPNQFIPWPQISQDYPLNLSILISGGKENNSDCLSNGEWSGKSSNLKSPAAT